MVDYRMELQEKDLGWFGYSELGNICRYAWYVDAGEIFSCMLFVNDKEVNAS